MSTKRDISPSGDDLQTSKPKRPKLSKAQLERKRECDREAQRQIRLKTKNRIAHLEGLVRALQQGHSDQGRMNELVDRLNESQQEINRLREIIRGVNKLVEGVDLTSLLATKSDKDSDQPKSDSHSGDRDDDDDMCHVKLPDLPTTSKESSVQLENPFHDEQTMIPVEQDQTHVRAYFDSPQANSTGNKSSHSSPEQCALPDQVVVDTGNDASLPIIHEDDFPLVHSNQEQAEITQNINKIAVQIIQDRMLDGRLWYLAGSLLSFILTMPQHHQTPLEYEEDIPVRAVLHGWASVTARYYLDPGWLWLRHLDESLYSALGVPERLAIMRVMRMQYQAQVRPYLTPDLALPGFMIARPAQAYLEHDPLVEHFVWPGIREHILFAPRKYATNRFMDSFRNYCRFVWNHHPEDTFVRNDLTGMYSYSLDFITRQADLRCWSMRSEFFNLFPELRNDIPSFDESFPITNLALSFEAPKSSKKLLLEEPQVAQDCGDQDDRDDRGARCRTLSLASFSGIED
ncbi:hypothetical protein PV10_06106 [Exophiala mesophila]|uniref:BZIP domain-containing protein n=1 Tax=Exophiala mesophila TaxID=212818 RepID=A0A0D1XTU9_EXOME|nr:uncharacterized protein PV10_06106 [Exophiala mesophila]KIV91586.1 hypothetical protein PV10_06106 [Exophiala mesophila]